MANELFIEISAEQQEVVAGGSGAVASGTTYGLGIFALNTSSHQIIGGSTSSGPLGSTAVQPSSAKSSLSVLAVNVNTTSFSQGIFF